MLFVSSRSKIDREGRGGGGFCAIAAVAAAAAAAAARTGGQDGLSLFETHQKKEEVCLFIFSYCVIIGAIFVRTMMFLHGL